MPHSAASLAMDGPEVQHGSLLDVEGEDPVWLAQVPEAYTWNASVVSKWTGMASPLKRNNHQRAVAEVLSFVSLEPSYPGNARIARNELHNCTAVAKKREHLLRPGAMAISMTSGLIS